MVLTIAVVAAGGALVYLYYKNKENLGNALNPASSENVVYSGLENTLGQDTVAEAGDSIFGFVDLINPWAPEYRRNYARQVYGLIDESGGM